MMLMGLLRQLILVVVTLAASSIYIISSGVKRAWRALIPWRWDQTRLERRLQQAESYREWEKTALELDEMRGNNLWKLDPEAPKYYDAKGIQQRLRRLHRARSKGNIDMLMHLLPEVLARNLCGLGNLGLYRHCTVGTKKLIEDYIDEVVCCIREITYANTLTPSAKMEFLNRSVQAYGRSALLFSGGLSFGMYHWGVIKCLFEENLLPPVICGSSIGALFAAVLGIYNDSQLSAMFDDPEAIDLSAFERLGPKGWKRKLVRLFTDDVLMDISKLEEFCRTNLGDYTFDEAYRKTGRVINIVLTHTTHSGYPSLLNYRTAPNVLLWSAASASCAQPGLYAPVPLYAKDVGGGIVILHEEHVAESWSSRTVHHPQLPMQQLRENFNVNHLIVSQVNPHVIPFLRSLHSSSRVHILHQAAVLLGEEIVHRVRQVVQFGYLTKSLAWLRADLLQPVEGNITIIPRLTLTSLKKIVSNPNRHDLHYFRAEGERSVYPYLAIIRTRCRIEMALNDCLKQAQEMVHAAQNLSLLHASMDSPTQTPRSRRSPLIVTPPTQANIPPRRRAAPPESPTIQRSPHRLRRANTVGSAQAAPTLATLYANGYLSGDDEQAGGTGARVQIPALAERLLRTPFSLTPQAAPPTSPTRHSPTSTPPLHTTGTASQQQHDQHYQQLQQQRQHHLRAPTTPPSKLLAAPRRNGVGPLSASFNNAARHHLLAPRSAPASVSQLGRYRARRRKIGGRTTGCGDDYDDDDDDDDATTVHSISTQLSLD
ncbi:hypothetical protein PTSG_01087 [Salpingoeca rosetta]|uniref:PNPLA domain-containing protein n=1 Tax=Salpingoeca rosetta (strain ATCC 50818 / BSB-021) TaxID=946362 RepID=F2U0S1_SALR5|nr:uncharacterized protein PTSG_01087 [Salpingoeca rosetta]EGD80495.1 hypothetical protein PTSG_01087 [Salpingoeca rosetta]|eukprot:XP_004997056.1 hypothetical protein PTSG_01087 [Salpingoeca rosetta]